VRFHTSAEKGHPSSWQRTPVQTQYETPPPLGGLVVGGVVLAGVVLAGVVFAGVVFAGVVLAGPVFAGVVRVGAVVAGVVPAGLVVEVDEPQADTPEATARNKPTPMNALPTFPGLRPISYSLSVTQDTPDGVLEGRYGRQP
jgi:hypothetical protein